ncbi:MAG TPA: hypothetical protein VFZ27_05820 [Terriglobia bacterium]|nr:hypothetical protein [Terriglobia bacterium]
MPALFSAIDAIAPAFHRTKRQLFQPFRFAFWARMALIALATDEFYSSSGWSGFHYTMPSSRRDPRYILQSAVQPHWEYLKRYLPWIILGVVLLFGLAFLWAYVASIFRFILFDSVLTDRCAIREQWRRWASQGFRFFLWKVCLGLGALLALGVLVGAVILMLVTTRAYLNPGQHIALLVLGGLLAFLLLVGLIVVAALIGLFARDFVVPVMALENVGVIDGWRRVMALLGAEKKAYVGYVLMKVVLVVGSTIIFGILTLIAVILLFIPISIAGVGAYFFAKSEGLLWGLPAITAGIALGGTALAAICYVTALISAPAMVFFQAYVIDFFGSRYPELGARLSPPPAPPASPYFPDAGVIPAG